MKNACTQQAVWQDGGQRYVEWKLFVSLAFERCGELGGYNPPPRQAAGTLEAMRGQRSGITKRENQNKNK